MTKSELNLLKIKIFHFIFIPPPPSQISCTLKQVFFENYTTFGFIHLPLSSDHSPCPCCWGARHSMMLPPQRFTVEMVSAGDEQHQVFTRHSAQSFLNLLYVWCRSLIDRVLLRWSSFCQNRWSSVRMTLTSKSRKSPVGFKRLTFQLLRPLIPWEHSQLEKLFLLIVFLNYVQSICHMWTPN